MQYKTTRDKTTYDNTRHDNKIDDNLRNKTRQDKPSFGNTMQYKTNKIIQETAIQDTTR